MQISRPVPTSRPRRPGRKRKIAALTTLGLAGLLAGFLAGCGTGNSPQINAVASAKSYTAAAGNWKFTSGTAAFAGALAVSGTTVTATLHAVSATCPNSVFTASGSITGTDSLSLTSTNFPGGKLTIAGTLAADQHSLIGPTIAISGGACAAPAVRFASLSPRDTTSPTAQQYQPLTGNYNGTFTDSSGGTLSVAATLSQPTTPDANGVYHLTGYATFPNTPCLATPVLTDSTITGDTIQATYTDKISGSTVVGNGTFSADAQTLTITNWVLSGCGDDTGTGLLLRQTN